MSIASQLTALEGNISDAYDMVAQRGGTVPARKNMENLDDAIATIPSGGGSTPTTPTLTSATVSNGVITLTGTDFGGSPKVLMFNRKYDRYDAITPTTSSSTSATVPVGSIEYGYFSRVVKVENGGFESDVKFVYDDFGSLAQYFEVIVWCYGDGVYSDVIVPYGAAASDLSGGSTQNSQYYVNQYAVNYTVTSLLDGTSVTMHSRRIRGAEISPLCTDWSNYSISFLGQCGCFDQPLGFANLTKMNSNGAFLIGAYAFNSPMDVSGVEWVSPNFLRHCVSFNQPLNFAPLTYMGNNFLTNALSFNKPLVLRGQSGSVLSLGGNFMYNCVNLSQLTLENCDMSGLQSLFNTPNLTCINLHSSTGTGGQSLCCNTNMAGNQSRAYVNGVVINGDATSVDAWLAAFPDSSSGTYYRHLVRGTVTT